MTAVFGKLAKDSGIILLLLCKEETGIIKVYSLWGEKVHNLFPFLYVYNMIKYSWQQESEKES